MKEELGMNPKEVSNGHTQKYEVLDTMISSPGDLVGKRVAVTFERMPDYFYMLEGVRTPGYHDGTVAPMTPAHERADIAERADKLYGMINAACNNSGSLGGPLVDAVMELALIVRRLAILGGEAER